MKNRKKFSFSKILLIQESILIWLLTIAYIILAFYCVHNQYSGELPWITGVTGFAWSAYSISQACYYKKSEKENIKGGIVFETTLQEMKEQVVEEVLNKNVDTEDTVG